jgi:hypothetical protein
MDDDKAGVPEGYFELMRPHGDWLCSDDESPCDPWGVAIPRGSGYLWISEEVVNFRRNARSWTEFLKKREKTERAAADRMGVQRASVLFRVMFLGGKGVWTPGLMCEEGARKRGLDMNVAAADAKYWWAAGFVPLRPTPHNTK